MALQKFPSVDANLHTFTISEQTSTEQNSTEENSIAQISTEQNSTTQNSTEQTAPKEKKPKYSIKERAKIIFSNITVEPIMVFYVLPCVMSSIAVQNLSLEKACRVNLQINESICDAISIRNTSAYDAQDEIAVQKLVAWMTAWKSMLYSIIPSILLMFIGSWSDRRNRRKPVMMMPLFGEFVGAILLNICTYFFYQLPMEVNAVSESLPPALMGGWAGMFVGVFSYVSALSTPETRTVRIGALSMFASVSSTVGIAFSGYMYRLIGFYGVFTMTMSMYVVGLIYGYVIVKEVPIKPDKKRNIVVDFFDPKHIKETFHVAFKNGENNRKVKICTIMILVMVIIGPLHGEMQVMYLFVRYKYKWDEIDFSIFSTYNSIVHMLGTLFSLLFFSKYLKLHDSLLGIISSMSKILASFIFAFAPNSGVFYLGCIVEMFNGTSFIAMRSIMSKLVPADELGKLNSLFAVCESLMPLVYGPMYSSVYRSTIEYFPGMFYILGGLLTLPGVFIFLWLYYEDNRGKKKQPTEQEETMLKKQNNTQDTTS